MVDAHRKHRARRRTDVRRQARLDENDAQPREAPLEVVDHGGSGGFVHGQRRRAYAARRVGPLRAR
jgi:hypothetical protein